MPSIEDLRNSLPESAKDIRLNLQTVLQVETLTPAQKWGVAAACAVAARNAPLRDAVLAEARTQAGEAVVEDARAAAVLMGMNNVYYRFRHIIGKPEYSQKPARLRMQRLVKPETNKLDFELLCLAVSAVNNCESCVRSHEQAVTEAGLSDEAVHDAVRIAAVIQATAVALES
jgi:lipoyl-dependent peroxiredoxin subunit D